MNNFLICCILFLLSCSNDEAKKHGAGIIRHSASFSAFDACFNFDSLDARIRDGLVSKQEALKQIKILLPQLRNYFYKNGGQDFEESNWIFPVQGNTSKSIGGTNGNGYIASGYDYFDGNKHGGHPAHDIFIKDKNQEGIDDVTKRLVNVLSMTGGIVIAAESVWDTTSNLRGGKYIWIYDPCSNSFFYYAHNSKIFVQPCDIVVPGDTIATVGRTGLNAFKKRSPTHLHIMRLKLDGTDYPKPIDCYNDLTTIKH